MRAIVRGATLPADFLVPSKRRSQVPNDSDR